MPEGVLGVLVAPVTPGVCQFEAADHGAPDAEMQVRARSISRAADPGYLISLVDCLSGADLYGSILKVGIERKSNSPDVIMPEQNEIAGIKTPQAVTCGAFAGNSRVRSPGAG